MGWQPGVAVLSCAMATSTWLPPQKKSLLFWLSMPWRSSSCLAFSLERCGAPTFTEVLSFSDDSQHGTLHQGTLIFLLSPPPPVILFLGWTHWILLWLAPSCYVCLLSVLLSHSFQPNVPTVWGCAPSPVGAVPYHDAHSKVFSGLYLRWVGISNGIGGTRFSQGCCHHNPIGSKRNLVLSSLWDVIHPHVRWSTSILLLQTWVRFNTVCEKGLKQQGMRLNYGLICH